MNVQAPQTTEAAVDAIDRVRVVHVAALNAGDADAWTAAFTDDGVQMPPGFPSNEGREAIGAWSRAFLDSFEVNFVVSPNEVQVAGADWAFESGTWEIVLTPRAGGDASRDAGKYVTIYQRGQDGTWSMARDIWNSNSAPAGME